MQEAPIEGPEDAPPAAAPPEASPEHHRRFEIYRDGLLYEIVMHAIGTISNHISMLANREPQFRWEARPLERRRMPDRRLQDSVFVIDRRPDGGALVL